MLIKKLDLNMIKKLNGKNFLTIYIITSRRLEYKEEIYGK